MNDLTFFSTELQSVNRQTFFGQVIADSVQSGNVKECVDMIRDQYNDNPVMVEKIVGVKVINRIKKMI